MLVGLLVYGYAEVTAAKLKHFMRQFKERGCSGLGVVGGQRLKVISW